jgi:cytochrome c553
MRKYHSFKQVFFIFFLCSCLTKKEHKTCQLDELKVQKLVNETCRACHSYHGYNEAPYIPAMKKLFYYNKEVFLNDLGGKYKDTSNIHYEYLKYLSEEEIICIIDHITKQDTLIR